MSSRRLMTAVVVGSLTLAGCGAGLTARSSDALKVSVGSKGVAVDGGGMSVGAGSSGVVVGGPGATLSAGPSGAVVAGPDETVAAGDGGTVRIVETPSSSSASAPSEPVTATVIKKCVGEDITITEPGSNYVLSGSCGRILIAASGVGLTADAVKSLAVNGDHNAVVAFTIGSLSLSGNENNVTWNYQDSAPTDTGTGNTLIGP